MPNDENPTQRYIAYAESHNNLQTLKKLEALGIRETALLDEDDFLMGRMFDKAFGIYCIRGNLEGVLEGIASGVDVDNADDEGFTPLMIAALQNHADVAQVLLDVGAHVSTENRQGYTAFDLAKKRNSTAVLEVIQSSIPHADLPTVIHLAETDKAEAIEHYPKFALILFAYLLAIKDNEILLITLTRNDPEVGISAIDFITSSIISALMEDGFVQGGTTLEEYPPIEETFKSLPKNTLEKTVIAPLYYFSRCIEEASRVASEKALDTLFEGYTVLLYGIYSEWDSRELDSTLTSCFPGGVKARAQAEEKLHRRIASTGANKSQNLPKNTSSSKGGCYIATAAYGSYDCPQVWTLRRYRDHHLAETAPGRAFIKAYYAVSPAIVRRFGNNKLFNSSTRALLDKFVAKCQEKGYSSEPYNDRSW